jgi:Lon-like protease
VSRRLRTLLAGGVIFIALLILVFTLPVPYVILSPGPTYNTLGTDQFGKTIIVLNGTTAKATSGHLNMTTVNETTDSVTIFQALKGWLEHDEAVVPRSAVIPPGQSQQQVNQQNTQDFTESQDNAVAAASCQLGYPQRYGVVSVTSTGASINKLQPSDEFQTLDGAPVTTSAQLQAALAARPPGTTIALGVLRQAKPVSVQITLGPPVSDHQGGSLGVTTGEVCQLPFSVDLGLGNQIGGPSAGMMFALGIMDKVGTVDLTRGRFIAGTGTIDPSGAVGPIGGIQLKMIAARQAGASIFLAPADNCSDVKGAIPKGLDVIKVSTLAQAVTALEAPDGASEPHC